MKLHYINVTIAILWENMILDYYICTYIFILLTILYQILYYIRYNWRNCSYYRYELFVDRTNILQKKRTRINPKDFYFRDRGNLGLAIFIRPIKSRITHRKLQRERKKTHRGLRFFDCENEDEARHCSGLKRKAVSFRPRRISIWTKPKYIYGYSREGKETSARGHFDRTNFCKCKSRVDPLNAMTGWNEICDRYIFFSLPSVTLHVRFSKR